MAEIQLPAEPPLGGQASSISTPAPQHQKRGPSIHQIYALPAPIRTFPLPTFYPNNPISLFYIAYAWLGQVLQPPPREPTVIHNGLWSETTISVHITDEKSMRALWEQGFYGKGNLSRSEPNWLKREQVRRGLQEAHVSEIFTVQRREERAQAKWERARLEQEIIRQTRLEEAKQKAAQETTVVPPVPTPPAAPVGPLELLALPNSAADLVESHSVVLRHDGSSLNGSTEELELSTESAVPSEVTGDLPSDTLDLKLLDLANSTVSQDVSSADDTVEPRTPTDNQGGEIPKVARSITSSSDGTETKTLKRRKSVRFSPTVESATYELSDPPSPSRSPPVKLSQPSQANGQGNKSSPDILPPALVASSSMSDPIINKEHLQLMPEEAFFLSFGLGVLAVTDPATSKTLTSRELFTLLRQYSYFPPRNGPDEPDLAPDDMFLVHYAAYHHFRSLGWVPRAGIKFGVDWLLYARGPVFDHAEFGLIIIPSYSDPWWKATGKKAPQKSWAWLHGVVRVLSHVTKSLVLIYVDVPPPQKFEEALSVGITEALKLYKVREVMVKRWSSNRNR